MANLTESPVYESGVPQLETTTQAIGGAGGVMNAQAQALANRTKFLKDVLDSPTELANRLPDATTSVKGKVQLASTGQQDATKVPKATGAEIASILTAGGYSYASLTHASSHQHGGADEIATATPAANAIPKTDGSGKLDSWISDASASAKGKVQLAPDGGTTSETVVQANDTRLTTYGTWTPVLGGDSESGQTYKIQAGWYVKNNKFAVLTYRIKMSAKGTITGTLAKIKGLPFIGIGGGGGYSLNCGGHIGLYVPGANYAYGSKGGTADFRVTDITDNSELHGSIILTL